jgi:hypothetical protein
MVLKMKQEKWCIFLPKKEENLILKIYETRL